MKKRQGQTYGIDRLLPHTPDGNFLLYLLARMLVLILIGSKNHFPTVRGTQCNFGRTIFLNLWPGTSLAAATLSSVRMKKNSDPDGVSLCKERDHFPEHSTLDQYLANANHKDVCRYISFAFLESYR